jgi:hypothetical protein
MPGNLTALSSRLVPEDKVTNMQDLCRTPA